MAFAGLGGFIGGRSYKDDPEQGFHVKRAGNAALWTGLTGGAALAAGYGARRPLGYLGKKYMGHVGSGFKKEWSSYKGLVQSGEGRTGAFMRAFGTTGNMAGVGAVVGGVIGGMIGSRNDDTLGGTVKGAAIGAASGVAVRGVQQFSRGIKAATSIPVAGRAAKWGLAGIAAVGAFALGGKLSGEGKEPIATAAPSMTGSVEEYGAPGEYQDRMAALGASGDIVLGAHRGRHGR